MERLQDPFRFFLPSSEVLVLVVFEVWYLLLVITIFCFKYKLEVLQRVPLFRLMFFFLEWTD